MRNEYLKVKQATSITTTIAVGLTTFLTHARGQLKRATINRIRDKMGVGERGKMGVGQGGEGRKAGKVVKRQAAGKISGKETLV